MEEINVLVWKIYVDISLTAWLSRWKNVLSKQGVAAALSCSKEKPLDTKYSGCSVSPADFGRVEDIVFGDNELELRTVEGQSVIVP